MRFKSLVVIMLFVLFVLPGCGSGGGSSDPQSNAGDPASIDVGGNGAPAAGSAVLSWEPPTTNTDGSALSDLTGFKVYYGTTPGSYARSVNVGLVTRYSLNDLSSGTYYFTVTAYNAAGNESIYSNEVSKSIL